MNDETKWIIGEERRMGPFESIGTSIPCYGRDGADEVWFFALSEHKAYPPRQVFDTPQAAALGAIALHDETIRWASVQKQQMQDWYDNLEAKRMAEEKAAQEAANAPPKEAYCPVCKRRIGLVKGRFARHTWWPQGKRTPCGGSYREFVREEMKAA